MAKKTQLGYREIEERLTEAFVESYTPADEVGYELLYSFGKSERDIERYKEGKGILKSFDGLLIKGLFGFRDSATFRLTEIDVMSRSHSLLLFLTISVLILLLVPLRFFPLLVYNNPSL